jgi:hypothetical protein
LPPQPINPPGVEIYQRRLTDKEVEEFSRPKQPDELNKLVEEQEKRAAEEQAKRAALMRLSNMSSVKK